MATTLEELERRLAAVEQELADLRQFVVGSADGTPAKRGARMLLRSRLNQPAMDAAVEKTFKEMGITGQAPGIEKLREMMLAAGINPEDNELSREIDAGRGE